MPFSRHALRCCFVPCFALGLSATAQKDHHGRGYKPLPPTAPVVISVEKAANQKPLSNASVILRATRDGVNDGNMEMKTDPDGRVSIDLLEAGSHVVVQVLAAGYATAATEFDLPAEGKQVLVQMERPRSQVSVYGDGKDRPAQVEPGVQEHHPAALPLGATPTSVPPMNTGSPTAPLKTTPPVNAPAAVPGTSTVPSTPGSPQ